MAGLRVEPSGDWEVSSAARSRGRRSTADRFLGELLAAGPWLRAGETVEARPRRGVPGSLEASWAAPRGESAVLFVRYASGAIALAPPAAARGAGETRLLRFLVPAPGSAARRGLASRILRITVLRVLGGLVDRALPRLATNFETVRWERRGRATGLVRVTAEGLREGVLPRAEPAALPAPPATSLLLIHGILSDAESAFGSLAGVRTAGGRPLMAELERHYGGHVYALNHFTLGRSPEENAADLAAALPRRGALFDVVTHSRGGIVLRALVELHADRRFRLGRAVLVASPNGGSPLASPERWDAFVSWFANLADVGPKGPFSLALEFVAEAIRWLAHRAIGALPGAAALAPGSELLRALKRPPAGAYSALSASFVPEGALLRRLVDAGLRGFFTGANDLVVPTEGGWDVAGEDGSPAIPGERIGCFGPGGNLEAAVHHVTFFERRETAEFLWRALRGEPQGLGPIHPEALGHPRPALRRAGPGRPAAGAHVRTGRRSARPRPGSAEPSEPLQLVLLGAGPATARLLASYRNARVVEEVGTRGGAAGERMRRLIALHERIHGYLRGRPGLEPPRGDELLSYGSVLFETLFPGDVRRIYDTARSGSGNGGRLDIVFTSSLPWLADKPWELAYDAGRGAFLATEEVHLVRGVLSAIPADVLPRRRGPLRILVASAQPAGADPLSSREEAAAIRAAFAPLQKERLAAVDVLPHATPARLHQRIAAGRTDVLHLIAHGEFDAEQKSGFVLLEDGSGGAHPLDARALRQLLAGRGLSLVFLNACESGRGGRADFNRGVAPALVAAGLPAVVANQYSVLDTAATAFARAFYASLAGGASLGASAREARIALHCAAPASIDWAVPVLFARDPASALR